MCAGFRPMRSLVLIGAALLLMGCGEGAADRADAATPVASAAAGSEQQFGVSCDVQDSEAMGGGREVIRYSIDLDRMLWCVPETTCGTRPLSIVSANEAEITLFDDGDVRMDLERVSGIYTLSTRSRPEFHAAGSCTREPYTPVGDPLF